eukprot:CAMPEP_0117466078 /NCGR_PEP_ID=MMETSP0784-20121206/4957_1 /TAXON_ID=39447 /ORGANISM="" /LENGTH=201 /DNA_ID=CAMNT_0005260009 /DNA_START=421 /DNA_END=1027 /DNA_ORIENTATION=-
MAGIAFLSKNNCQNTKAVKQHASAKIVRMAVPRIDLREGVPNEHDRGVVRKSDVRAHCAQIVDHAIGIRVLPDWLPNFHVLEVIPEKRFHEVGPRVEHPEDGGHGGRRRSHHGATTGIEPQGGGARTPAQMPSTWTGCGKAQGSQSWTKPGLGNRGGVPTARCGEDCQEAQPLHCVKVGLLLLDTRPVHTDNRRARQKCTL